MTTNQRRDCPSCGLPEHGSLARSFVATRGQPSSKVGESHPAIATPGTYQEILQWLAEQEKAETTTPKEKEYIERRGEGWRPTSHYFPRKVARFPLLRRKCEKCDSAGWVQSATGEDYRCSWHRHGIGWVVVDSLETIAKSFCSFMLNQPSSGLWSDYLYACARGDKEGAVQAVYEAMKQEVANV